VGAALGPGLLYAGASIGTSHLVQATRAGALAGFGLVGLVLAALILKYPFFDFGARYTAATRTDLVRGYREIGLWALCIFLIATLLTGGFAGIALTRLTAVLLAFAFGGEDHLLAWVSFLSLSLTLIVLLGGYRNLDRLMKGILALLAFSTLAAAFAALPLADFSTLRILPTEGGRLIVPLAFVLAVVGWMPSPLDVSAWHSLWASAKARSTGFATGVPEARADIAIGYAGSSLLALAFLALGAAVMHGSGETMSTRGSVFSTQLVDLYVRTLGAWSRPLVLAAVLTTMLSTLLALADAVPRALSAAWSATRRRDAPRAEQDVVFRSSLIGLGLFSVVGNAFFSGSFTAVIDLATILAFMTAPILGILNLRLVTTDPMPRVHRPGPLMRAYAWLAIGLAFAFSAIYLAYRFDLLDR